MPGDELLLYPGLTPKFTLEWKLSVHFGRTICENHSRRQHIGQHMFGLKLGSSVDNNIKMCIGFSAFRPKTMLPHCRECVRVFGTF